MSGPNMQVIRGAANVVVVVELDPVALLGVGACSSSLAWAALLALRCRGCCAD